jgi:hypothetical protein
MFELVPPENEVCSEADILVQVPKLLVMHNDTVTAQSLISWQRKTQKCEKWDFEKVKDQLEIAPTPERMTVREWHGYGLGA